MTASLLTRAVNFGQPADAAAFIALLDHYASDPMGGGSGLSAFATANLVPRLAARSDFFAFIVWAGDQPVGLINLIEGFSTFAARPLLNVHDVVVHADWRGRGVVDALFAAAEALAVQRDCCKLTLEVLEGNPRAAAAYARCGFKPYELDPEFGRAVFMEKKLP
ncbi:GNAT family N-acetyltransferase [Chitinilyticum piscinae]|uniref:GNAT family N-acetyltransferase n=1 Tax=Chitinilyticum piscinae TaxID=2866724 RepID=A0A8J7FXB3_9NEIS|nr:GNAT family N-acetyltransferase [Chitinilyticum piscinae]MBE9608360.1 GNAT family N-acetyltransferase [Chitinilyticum piscinae]